MSSLTTFSGTHTSVPAYSDGDSTLRLQSGSHSHLKSDVKPPITTAGEGETKLSFPLVVFHRRAVQLITPASLRRDSRPRITSAKITR